MSRRAATIFAVLALLAAGFFIRVGDRNLWTFMFRPVLTPRSVDEAGDGDGENRELLRENFDRSLKSGNVGDVVSGGPTTNSTVVHRVETGVGHAILFGTITSLRDGSMTVDYTEGVAPVSGTQETKDRVFLDGLTFPQFGQVAIDTTSKQVISVTILQTKR